MWCTFIGEGSSYYTFPSKRITVEWSLMGRILTFWYVNRYLQTEDRAIRLGLQTWDVPMIVHFKSFEI